MRRKSERFLDRHNNHSKKTKPAATEDKWARFFAIISIAISLISIFITYKQWPTYQAYDTFKFWDSIEHGIKNQTQYSNNISISLLKIRSTEIDKIINRRGDTYSCSSINKFNRTLVPSLTDFVKNGSAIYKSYDLTVLANDRLARTLGIKGWTEFRASDAKIHKWWGIKILYAGNLSLSLIIASASCNGNIDSKVKIPGNVKMEATMLKTYMLNDLTGTRSPNISAYKMLIQKNR